MIIDIIVGVILPLVLLILAGYLVRTRHNEQVIEWVKIAVKAAEQIYTTPGQGKEKFDYVATWISEKFKINKADLKNLIESAVYELTTAQKD